MCDENILFLPVEMMNNCSILPLVMPSLQLSILQVLSLLASKFYHEPEILWVASA
jgi:hypothetical protein